MADNIMKPMTAYERDADNVYRLRQIEQCWIKVEHRSQQPVTLRGARGAKVDKYYFTALPELSWSKRANYNSQPIIGRPTPIITYAHSGPKSVTITIHMHAPTRADLEYNISALNYLASALHPRLDYSYAPPPLCTFHCGPGTNKTRSALTSPMQHFRFIMTDMKQNMGSEPVWDTEYMMPRTWDVDISGDVVYPYYELPGAGMVIKGDW